MRSVTYTGVRVDTGQRDWATVWSTVDDGDAQYVHEIALDETAILVDHVHPYGMLLTETGVVGYVDLGLYAFDPPPGPSSGCPGDRT